MVSIIIVVIVAAIHFYFLYLEMFKWEAPRTRTIFGTTAEFAKETKVLAANQGLYNGFIAMGLIVAGMVGDGQMAMYLLCCVVIAGLYAASGGLKRSLVVQSLPALIAIILIWIGL